MPPETMDSEPQPRSESAGHYLDPSEYPDVSHLITEDDTSVDDIFSERQMRLLVESLQVSWEPEFPFVAMANVGLYLSLNGLAVVPDVLLATHAQHPPDLLKKEHRCYLPWIYGKEPDLVIEVVSNREGGELTRKMKEYAHHRITYYAVFDPAGWIQKKKLKCYALLQGAYEEMQSPEFPFGLRLTEWTGNYEGSEATWLRWTDREGKLLLTGKESKSMLEAKLRSLGVDPKTI